MPFIIALGIIAFLVMEHTVVFFLIFIPLLILMIGLLIYWFKAGGTNLSTPIYACVILIILIIMLLFLCIP